MVAAQRGSLPCWDWEISIVTTHHPQYLAGIKMQRIIDSLLNLFINKYVYLITSSCLLIRAIHFISQSGKTVYQSKLKMMQLRLLDVVCKQSHGSPQNKIRRHPARKRQEGYPLGAEGVLCSASALGKGRAQPRVWGEGSRGRQEANTPWHSKAQRAKYLSLDLCFLLSLLSTDWGPFICLIKKNIQLKAKKSAMQWY